MRPVNKNILRELIVVQADAETIGSGEEIESKMTTRVIVNSMQALRDTGSGHQGQVVEDKMEIPMKMVIREELGEDTEVMSGDHMENDLVDAEIDTSE